VITLRPGSGPALLRARTISNEVTETAESLAEGREWVTESGDWGEITDIERIYHPVDVVGLGAPSEPDEKASAKFGFSVKAGGGVEVSVGIATFGLKATYGVEDGLTIPGEKGSASVGTLMIPMNRITQLFRPDDSPEWFPRWRYELVMLDPLYPGVGVDARLVKADELFGRRHLPGRPVGGGGAPISETVSRSIEVEVSASFALPLTAKGKDGPGVTLSVSVTGAVAVDVEYELPKGTGYEMFWLEGIAGACFVRR
jgi:hypothetical protein